jgi:hypothetical protein
LIDEFFVVVRKVRISNQVRLAHAMGLEKINAYYPITRVDVQNRTINMGVTSERFENLVKGTLPKRLCLGMVSSAAFNGSYNNNPFNFQHFNLSELSV